MRAMAGLFFIKDKMGLGEGSRRRVLFRRQVKKKIQNIYNISILFMEPVCFKLTRTYTIHMGVKVYNEEDI